MYYWIHQSFYMAKVVPFIGGWLADRLLGDPEGWPHPVVGFGKVISLGEKTMNKGDNRALKGGIMALVLVIGTYLICEDTKKVLKEIPPEKTLDMIAKVWELAGLMVDEKR